MAAGNRVNINKNNSQGQKCWNRRVTIISLIKSPQNNSKPFYKNTVTNKNLMKKQNPHEQYYD